MYTLQWDLTKFLELCPFCLAFYPVHFAHLEIVFMRSRQFLKNNSTVRAIQFYFLVIYHVTQGFDLNVTFFFSLLLN